jgi:hypothetical protein
MFINPISSTRKPIHIVDNDVHRLISIWGLTLCLCFEFFNKGFNGFLR